MKTIEPPEIIAIDDEADEVRCDGGNGALGHPVVWYTFDRSDFMECGYCDRAFVKKRALASFKKNSRKTA